MRNSSTVKIRSVGPPGAGRVALAIVHHANQYLITNGYNNREGVDDLVTAYLKILKLHQRYLMPLNLHLSGTLLEALLWHRPDFLSALRVLWEQGLLELVGSSYGQNIMRFFSPEHNLRQLNEELELYREHLGIDPRQVQVFWPPERVWDTERLAPVLADSRLHNGGYSYILIDDRVLHPTGGGSFSREDFDRAQKRHSEDFALCRIAQGEGLKALPMANDLRQNIPPSEARNLRNINELLHWLAAAKRLEKFDLIAIYGDDLEKTAGMGGWDVAAPGHYAKLLRWLSRRPWIRPVKLSEWAATHRVNGTRRIDVGTFVEMSNAFGAGEGYENWYYDPQWDTYRDYYAWSEQRVKTLSALGADPGLIELAWKQLLATSYETAWHTPASGVHGDATSTGEPSPWSKALASHCRHAAVIAEAAYWMRHRDAEAHAYPYDIDNDGEEELILKNDKLFAVFAPRWGGRLVYLFSLDGAQGRMVVGNPCDDWNWMEELNKYMEVPANHPGLLADRGYEHDRYGVRIDLADGRQLRVRLVNRQPESLAAGTVKILSLAQGDHEIRVTYELGERLSALWIEGGLSPDYRNLLRFGHRDLSEFRDRQAWECSNRSTRVWLHLKTMGTEFSDGASRREIGHGRTLSIKAWRRRFTIGIGARQVPARPTQLLALLGVKP